MGFIKDLLNQVGDLFYQLGDLLNQFQRPEADWKWEVWWSASSPPQKRILIFIFGSKSGRLGSKYLQGVFFLWGSPRRAEKKNARRDMPIVSLNIASKNTCKLNPQSLEHGSKMHAN